jgi:hypothetical protein
MEKEKVLIVLITPDNHPNKYISTAVPTAKHKTTSKLIIPPQLNIEAIINYKMVTNTLEEKLQGHRKLNGKPLK